MNNSRRKLYKKIKLIALYTVLIIYAAGSLYPLFFTAVSSFKTSMGIFKAPFELPKTLNLENYIRAWNQSQIGRYLGNSLKLSIATCFVAILLGSLAAYGLSKFDFKLKKVIYLFFLMGMMIPIQSTIIPLAFDMGKLKIYDNLTMVIFIMGAFQLPMSILIFTGFISDIPDSLIESAVIDGCNTARVYLGIIFPLAKPATVTILIMTFLNSWNNILFPLVFLNADSVKPIAIGILSFAGAYQVDYSGIMASIVMTCLPPLLIYIFAQEKIQKGLTEGAVKG